MTPQTTALPAGTVRGRMPSVLALDPLGKDRDGVQDHAAVAGSGAAAGGPDNDGLSREARGLPGEPGEDADADAGGGADADAGGWVGVGRTRAGGRGAAGVTGGGVPLVGFSLARGVRSRVLLRFRRPHRPGAVVSWRPGMPTAG
ncbi:hypothetical protein [Streptomyces cyaneofuscatus]|uniref:hypothetical protein n=1 Tax=Streptomyces cyaneofuscatus TaxID=66883 RepID=UPI00364B9479